MKKKEKKEEKTIYVYLNSSNELSHVVIICEL